MKDKTKDTILDVAKQLTSNYEKQEVASAAMKTKLPDVEVVYSMIDDLRKLTFPVKFSTALLTSSVIAFLCSIMFEDKTWSLSGSLSLVSLCLFLLECISKRKYFFFSSWYPLWNGNGTVKVMIIGNDKKLYIIDFDRDDFGDPWEEFNRIVWCAQAAPAFASGMVDGYFDGNVPMDFWKLLALYISSNALGSIPWAIPYGDEEVQVMRQQAAEVLQWYDGMRNVVPTWYGKD